jgi:NTE family protein
MPPKRPTTTAQAKPSVALVLQGGGALGAYHIGAYQAIAEAHLHPDWVSGISIGAINAALVAGNAPEDRVDRLAAFWEAISWPEFVPPTGFEAFQTLHNWASNAEALLLGQPNFFTPRPINPMLVASAPPPEVSFYDTTPLRFTLGRYADFARINRGETRLSLGATRIDTGDLVFFDNFTQPLATIGPEHVLASGSLPPGFPATRVGEHFYWDGGCVSNTPLDAITERPEHPRLLVIMVDLWPAAGKVPENMNEAFWRAKQIQYASRTGTQIAAHAARANLRHALALLKRQGAPAADPGAETAPEAARRLDILHVVYHPGKDQIPNSDAEFSRSSIAERRAAGYRDMAAALATKPWERPLPTYALAMVHRHENGQAVTPLSDAA